MTIRASGALGTSAADRGRRHGVLTATILIAALGLAATGNTSAQRLSVTALAGQRFGGELHSPAGEDPDIDGSSSFGLVVGIALDDESWIEILASRQQTRLESGTLFSPTPLFDLEISYLHVGGLFRWERGRVRPFITGSLGLTHLDPRPSDLEAETRFSVSFGGGLLVEVSEHVGIRFEGRGFGTFIDTDSRIFCRSGSGASCLVQLDGDILVQGELSVGLAIEF